MVADHPVQVLPHRRDLPAVRRRFETTTGKQWTQPLLHYAVFEVVPTPSSAPPTSTTRKTIVDAITATDLDTIAATSTGPAGAPLNPVPNVYNTPLVGGQWVKGTKYPFDLMIVSNGVARRPRSRRR